MRYRLYLASRERISCHTLDAEADEEVGAAIDVLFELLCVDM
jgi:hypothetical protein